MRGPFPPNDLHDSSKEGNGTSGTKNSKSSLASCSVSPTRTDAQPISHSPDREAFKSSSRMLTSRQTLGTDFLISLARRGQPRPTAPSM